MNHSFKPSSLDARHAPWSMELRVPSHTALNLAEQIATEGFSFLLEQRPNLAESMLGKPTTFTEPIAEEGLVLRYYADATRAKVESDITNPLDYHLRGWSKGALAIPRSLAIVHPKEATNGAVVILEQAPGFRYDHTYSEAEIADRIKDTVKQVDAFLGVNRRKILLGDISIGGEELYINGKTTYLTSRPSKLVPSWLISRTTASVARS